jgi:hypothetical protein
VTEQVLHQLAYRPVGGLQRAHTRSTARTSTQPFVR